MNSPSEKMPVQYSLSSKGRKVLRILGTRGVPASHGGFETFAEQLALYLVRRDWDVIVYCQDDGGSKEYEDIWQGVRRVHVPVSTGGVAGTIVFDWKSTLHAAREPGLILTLGYNTAVFCAWYRLKGITNVINMDGIEWRRQKWGKAAKLWFYLNEWAGAWLGNHLVADHPGIKTHLSTRVRPRKITTIAYGAPRLDDADVGHLSTFGLIPNNYAIVIARPEPENSLLEIVRAWSRRPTGYKLVVLGRYSEDNAYHRQVRSSASDEVVFPGAIYDSSIVGALRFHARFYIHGHQVGGTNPSLVESLGAGNAVLAHDNQFNRWVAGDGARFFSDEAGCASAIEQLLKNDNEIFRMKELSRTRHEDMFTWEKILAAYEEMLESYVGEDHAVPAARPLSTAISIGEHRSWQSFRNTVNGIASSGSGTAKTGVNQALNGLQSSVDAILGDLNSIDSARRDELMNQMLASISGLVDEIASGVSAKQEPDIAPESLRHIQVDRLEELKERVAHTASELVSNPAPPAKV